MYSKVAGASHPSPTHVITSTNTASRMPPGDAIARRQPSEAFRKRREIEVQDRAPLAAGLKRSMREKARMDVLTISDAKSNPELLYLYTRLARSAWYRRLITGRGSPPHCDCW